MRVGFVEWPEGLEPQGSQWNRIAEMVASTRIDLLITNELPFGSWIAAERSFTRRAAQASVDVHNAGLSCLSELGVPAVLSSRPVWSDGRLANEAFVTECGKTRRLHRKQYFPSEPGWTTVNIRGRFISYTQTTQTSMTAARSAENMALQCEQREDGAYQQARGSARDYNAQASAMKAIQNRCRAEQHLPAL